MLDMVIVGIVYDAPMTGYDIKKKIEQGVFFKASYGSLYPALARMAATGLLTMSETEGGRRKKFYQATPAGRDGFLAWLGMPFDPASGEDMLLKIYFFGRLPLSVREKRLSELAAFQELTMHRLKALEAEAAAHGEGDAVGYFELATLYYSIKKAHTTGLWLSHLADRRPLGELLSGKSNSEPRSKGSEFAKKLLIPKGFEDGIDPPVKV
jgi:DNA-binding PadR family transcriptional regulator